MKKKLETLLESLNEIEVHGKKSVTLMAAIIPYVENLMNEAEEKEKPTEEAE